ncbi:MAG: AAA family ATPase [Bacteriovoracaceae bacterium]
MQRYLNGPVQELLSKKMLLLMGPRQVGKTTLSKSITNSYAYHNYDIKKDIQIFQKQIWDRSKELVIFDELHKMKKWKLWLKGIWDDEVNRKQQFLVTGSARLDIAKKMGDSLAGRFFSIRMNPIDLKEAKSWKPKSDLSEVNYKKLLSVGGFPEPFIDGTEKFYNLWQKTHSDLIVRQDLILLENIRDLDGIETLIEMLATRVGSTISYNSIAEDLGRDDKTVKKWVEILEKMYIVFKVSPYSKNVVKGLKKASKIYFYDLGKVEGDESQKLENLVALSLKKELELLEDSAGIPGNLYFIQNKQKQEIDFVTIQKKRTPHFFEVKLSDNTPSKNFDYFENVFPSINKIQLVRNLDREYLTKNKICIRNVLTYLEKLDLS